MDSDRHSLRAARRLARSGEQYFCGDLHDLSRFRAGSFEPVFCRGVLRHCKDPTRVLSEFHRVFKARGHLFLLGVLCEPDFTELFRALSYFRTVRPKHYWTHNQFLMLVRHMGFHPEVICPVEYLAPLNSWTQPTGVRGLESARNVIENLPTDIGIPGVAAGLAAKLKETRFFVRDNQGLRLRWEVFEMRCMKDAP